MTKGLFETAFPDLHKHKEHQLTYSNTEYLYDINGAINYTLTGSQTNPGLMESFPILSGFATQFETYRFTKLSYYYKPFVTSVLSSSNVQLGFIGMTYCYDPDEQYYTPESASSRTLFPSKASFLNYTGSISSKSSVPMRLDVDCSKFKHRLLYVRHGEFNTIDLRMSDMGFFAWAVGDQQSAHLMGELYVSYSIEFMKSKPNYSLANCNKFARYQMSGTINTGAIFGEIQTPKAGTTMRLQFSKTSSTVQTIHLPPMPALCNYMFVMRITGDSTSWVWTLPTFSGIPLMSSSNESHSVLNGTSEDMIVMLFFNTPLTLSSGAGSFNQDAQIVIDSSTWTLPTNITHYDMYLMQIPTNAYSP